jgi:alpha/beta superfamily hydrolase
VIYHAMKVVNDPAWGFGWPALRFNFRGTGLSEGVHDGLAESEDVRAALDWLENEYNRPAVLVGFSFGAAMAIRACCGRDENSAGIAALIALGLPTEAEGRRYEYRSLAHCAVPKFFVSGNQDQYAPASQLAAIAESAAQPRKLAWIAGADHFFTGQLDRMQQALQAWLRGQFQ